MSETTETKEGRLEAQAGNPAGEQEELNPAEVLQQRHEEEVRRLKSERDQMGDQLLRAMADFDNFRKRTQKELGEQRILGALDALQLFLPIADGFERALQAGGSPETFRKGMELIYRQMQDAMRRVGLEAVPAAGEPFDPHVHEAVEMVETEDVPHHHVVEELQRGYRYKEKLLRPAMVRVAQNEKQKSD